MWTADSLQGKIIQVNGGEINNENTKQLIGENRKELRSQKNQRQKERGTNNAHHNHLQAERLTQ